MNDLILIKKLEMRFPNPSCKQKVRFGIYKCFCGKEFETRTASVNNGKTKSCGCLKGETHNEAGTRLYRTWQSIKRRCLNPNAKDYLHYGGRGITVCDEWRDSYTAFKTWANANGYQQDLTIDRIDSSGNYEPNNCRWATKSVQSRNTKRIHKHNTSGYRGVSYYKKLDKFIVGITVCGKKKHLGYFDNPLDGAIAYDKYIIENNLEHTTNGIVS